MTIFASSSSWRALLASVLLICIKPRTRDNKHFFWQKDAYGCRLILCTEKNNLKSIIAAKEILFPHARERDILGLAKEILSWPTQLDLTNLALFYIANLQL